MSYLTGDVDVSIRDVSGGAGEVGGVSFTGGRGSAGVGGGSLGTSMAGVAEESGAGCGEGVGNGAGAGSGCGASGLLHPAITESMTKAVIATDESLNILRLSYTPSM